MTPVRILSLALFSCALTSLPAAAARLEIPEELIVQAVDGHDLGFQLFNTKDHIEIAPGAHRIAVKYKDLFELGGDQHEVVASEPVLLAFAIPGDGTYRLRFNKPETVEKARKFAESPQFSVIDASGAALAASQLTQEQQQSMWEKSLGFGDNSDAAKMTAQSATPVAVSTAVVATSAPAPTSAEQQMAADQLRYWWNKADAQTRAEFLSVIQGTH